MSERQKIARGTGIVFAGTVISMFFGFLSRAVTVRFLLLSLCVVVQYLNSLLPRS
ncbi:hypothetical protein [Thermococcus sp. M39]|uniref:hypothetical protein n=1 Tax=Thermococcus sp. M39 TaxID=1638262 RepID=UPI0014398A11|nr:hypothetical protein [Thermococcus sp. M39]